MGRPEGLVYVLSAGRATFPCSLRHFWLGTTLVPCIPVFTSTLFLPAPPHNISHTRSVWLSPPACPGLAFLQQPALQLLGGIKSQAIKEASSLTPARCPWNPPSRARPEINLFLSILADSTHGSLCPYRAIIQMDRGSPEGWVPCRAAMGQPYGRGWRVTSSLRLGVLC